MAVGHKYFDLYIILYRNVLFPPTYTKSKLTCNNGTLGISNTLCQRSLAERATAGERGSILAVGDRYSCLLVSLLFLLQADGKCTSNRMWQTFTLSTRNPRHQYHNNTIHCKMLPISNFSDFHPQNNPSVENKCFQRRVEMLLMRKLGDSELMHDVHCQSPRPVIHSGTWNRENTFH